MGYAMNDLVEALRSRKESMDEMLQVLLREREAIIGFDTDGLQAATARKGELVSVIESQDRLCRELLAREAVRHGLAGEVTLSPVIARSAPAEKSELAGLQERILALAGEVRRMLEDNRRLLESSLGTIGRSLAFFKSRLTVSDTYGGSGQMVERTAATSLLRKEV